MKISQVHKKALIVIFYSTPPLGLTQQLSQPGVGYVTSILEKAKSSYLEPFIKLAQQIKVST